MEDISGPKVPDIIHPPITTNEPAPVERKSGVRRIRDRASAYEDFDRWLVEDRVTISPEGRRRYQAMLAAKRNKFLEN